MPTLATVTARSRRLCCPYCRQPVGRLTSQLCARDRCGARYHTECWDECRRLYGACAVLGCGAGEAAAAFPTARSVLRWQQGLLPDLLTFALALPAVTLGYLGVILAVLSVVDAVRG